MKLGVVVVTHGQLANELVNSAEVIVRGLPQHVSGGASLLLGNGEKI